VSGKGRTIGTRAVHGHRKPVSGPLIPPVVQSATFVMASSAEMRRYLEGDEGLYLYTRYANPTVRVLEEHLAALEEGEDALALASGMAAATTGILSLLEPGDEVLASASLYGGTARFVRDILPRFGFRGRVVPVPDLVKVASLAGERTRVIVVESPTNPMVEIGDLAAVAAAAHDRGIAVFVDNTFATPVVQRPLKLGADLVMHSLSKALGGHSDIIGGALVGSRARIEKAHALLKVLGGCIDPHTAFLVERGLKTVHLRVQRQCENAMALAARLEKHPKIRRVVYPGLASHPGHEVARRQMSAFGGIVAFVLAGGLPAAEKFYDALQLVSRAASLGGVESLISLPVHTSHHGFSDAQLAEAGVDPGAARISVGVEDAADIIADVERALESVPAA
jgi:cystathionine beta-lyase/cystathionine gamma-synthase